MHSGLRDARTTPFRFHVFIWVEAEGEIDFRHRDLPRGQGRCGPPLGGAE